MYLSTEAIVAIVTLIVGAPCTVIMLWKFYRRQRGGQPTCRMIDSTLHLSGKLSDSVFKFMWPAQQ